jgi:hypothetical protein
MEAASATVSKTRTQRFIRFRSFAFFPSYHTEQKVANSSFASPYEEISPCHNWKTIHLRHGDRISAIYNKTKSRRLLQLNNLNFPVAEYD